MAEVTVQIINAFTDEGRGGNPAGVVLDADRFDREMKQRIAARVGVSETAFVSASDSAAFKLEFFTPTRQIAHCGHATVATFSYLAQLGRVSGEYSSKETIDGNRTIVLRGEVAYMEQVAPRYMALPHAGVSVERVLDSLGVGEDALLEGQRPVVVNTGNSFLIVPLRDLQTMRALQPQPTQIERVSEALDLIGYYPFTLETEVAGRDAAARMFAPRYGIPEESATGTAVGTLGSYLYDMLKVGKSELVVEQGRLMEPPMPSELLVSLHIEGDRVAGLLSGGRAQVMRSLHVVAE